VARPELTGTLSGSRIGEREVDQPVSFRPWGSISAGVVERASEALTFEEALSSPCRTCTTSPCCTHLPIHNFRVGTVGDLSYAAYLLNFDHIRLGVSRAGDWSVYYVHPCRFLDTDRFTCTVHDTDLQPEICRNYNPYHCWYKKSLTASTTEDFVLLDRARLEFLTAHVTFDDLRNVVGMPDWDELVVALDGISDDDPWATSEVPIADPVYDEWERVVFGGSVPAANAAPLDFAADNDPCGGCSAPCCETLVFPQGLPATKSAIDFYRFCLGFPGVELSISDAGWSLVVKTRCRHLVAGRCSIFGQPERPLFCRYYDAWKCTYRVEFGEARPADSVRARLDDLPAVTECFSVDAYGTIVGTAAVGEIRARIEQSWRDRGAVTTPVRPQRTRTRTPQPVTLTRRSPPRHLEPATL
jgi:hypothetical protein